MSAFPTLAIAALLPFLLWAERLPTMETRNHLGWGPGQIDNLNAGGRPVPNGPAAAATPGSLARITVAGAPAAGEVELFLGTRAMDIVSRRTVNGQLELTFRIPVSAPQGCYVPLHLKLSGSPVRNSVAIAVDASGACQLPGYQPSLEWFLRRTAVAIRVRDTEWHPETASETTSDTIFGAFFEGDRNIVLGPLLFLPPAGLCSTHSRPFDSGRSTVETALPLLVDQLDGATLDGGDFLTIDDRHKQLRIPPGGQPGFYRRTIDFRPNETPLVDLSGTLSLRGSGGVTVGPFVVPLRAPASFQWLSRPTSPTASLRRSLPVRWNATAAGHVLVAAGIADAAHWEMSYCTCLVAAQAGHFEIPKQILRNLWTSARGEAAGAIFVVHLPHDASTFQANGIENGVGYSLQIHSSKMLFTW